MTSTKELSITSILEEYANYVYYEGDPKRGGITLKEAVAQIEILVKERVIERDDPITKRMKVDTPWIALDNRHRNDLRTTQRTNLKQLLGGEIE